MVFLMDCLRLNKLLQLCIDACAFVPFLSLTAYIVPADCECGIPKDAYHPLTWRGHLSITAVNVQAKLFKV